MNAKSTVPVLEIKTPAGQATLVNAKILNVTQPAPHHTPKHGADTSELEEFDLVFNKITYTNVKHGKKGLSDSWATGG
jgi:type VI protein secretion system component Hcp